MNRSQKLTRNLKSRGYSVRVYWEQLGPALLMGGHTGGYMVDLNGQQNDSLGYSYDEALNAINSRYPELAN